MKLETHIELSDKIESISLSLDQPRCISVVGRAKNGKVKKYHLVTSSKKRLELK